MKKDNYYTSGAFAKKAKITLRTVRYYDKKNILKPTFVNDSGTRFYTDEDFTRLQQILLLKYLGFTLDEIKEMTMTDIEPHLLMESFQIQLKLIRDRIEEMKSVELAIEDTIERLEVEKSVDWSGALRLIHLTNMEKSVKSQYLNATNLSARIQLHKLYSMNTQGWFPWIYEQCQIEEHKHILEIGCGDGSLWKGRIEDIPSGKHITLSDISAGILNDARREINDIRGIVAYQELDCHDIPYGKESFDLVVANHVLFYCQDIDQVCNEVSKVLDKEGIFICSTYGQKHMQEITSLVKGFDERIVLSADVLYDRFGKENGREVLEKHFEEIKWHQYEDSLLVPDASPLISYILSCHGNQNQYILGRYKEFVDYVEKKIKKNFVITKDAGIFICKKK